MKKLVLGVLAVIAITSLVACGEKENVTPAPINNNGASSVSDTNNTASEVVTPNENNSEEVNSGEVISGEVSTNVPKSEQTGTAGSNIPLKDNLEEAKHQIEVAMQYLLKETYGDEVFDARIYVEKVYTAEEEQEIEALKEMNLGPNEVAFEVKYELKPAAGVEDIMKFTAATGEYDEETGWVKEKYNLGVLRPTDGSGEQKYKITDFGTGW